MGTPTKVPYGPVRLLVSVLQFLVASRTHTVEVVHRVGSVVRPSVLGDPQPLSLGDCLRRPGTRNYRGERSYTNRGPGTLPFLRQGNGTTVVQPGPVHLRPKEEVPKRKNEKDDP